MFEIGNKITGTLASNSKYGVTNTGMLCGEVVDTYKDNEGKDMIEVKIINHIDSKQEERNYAIENSEEFFRLISEEEVAELKKTIEVDKTSWVTDSGKQFCRELNRILGNIKNVVTVHSNKYCWISKNLILELLLPFYAANKEFYLSSIDVSLIHAPSGDDKIEEKMVSILSYAASKMTEFPIINIVNTKDNPKVRESLENVLSIDASPWHKQEYDFPDGVAVYRNSEMEIIEGEEKGKVEDFSNQLLVLANGVNDRLMISLMPFLYEFLEISMDKQDMPQEFIEAWKESLIDKNRDTFVESLNNAYEEMIKLERQRKRKEMLDKFSKRLPELRKNEYERKITDIKNRISDYETSLKNQYRELETYNSKLFYLMNGKPSEKLGEFGEFINNLGEKLKTISITGDDKIILCIESDLSFFDEDQWDILKESDGSYINRVGGYRRQLMYDIFDTKKLVMTFEQKLTIELGYFNIYATRRLDEYNNDAGEGLTGIPNPHLHYYNCWGDYLNMIRSLAEKYDLTMLVSQIIAAISSLNLSDGTVVESFISSELEDRHFIDIPCLRNTETGERFSIRTYKNKYEADEFKNKIEILKKSVEDITLEDNRYIDTAIDRINSFPEDIQKLLQEERKRLDELKHQIIELRKAEAEKFKEKHSEVLKKTPSDITLEDKDAVTTTTEEFCKLPSEICNLLKDVSDHLSELNTQLNKLEEENKKEDK